MLMNDLLKMRLFSLLTESSQEVSNTEMKSAYENFVMQVQNLNHSDNNYSVIVRTLNFIRIEFMALQTQILFEQEKKCA